MHKYTKFIDDVPKGINFAKGLYPWSCGCGQVDNWLCRSHCPRCGREQPTRVAQDAKRIAERTRREREDKRKDQRRRSPSRGRSTERRGRSRSHRKSSRDGGSRKHGNGKHAQYNTYADVAAKTESELRKQLAAEKRAKDELVKQLAAAKNNALAKEEDGGDDCGEGGGADDGGDGEEVESEEAKDLRQQKLTAAIDALSPVVDADDPKLLALRSERDALAKAKREGRPLKAQLLAIDRRLEKRKGAVRKVEEKLADARERVEAARKEAEQLEKECGEIQKEVEALEAEKRDVLRRELEGETGTTASDNGHFEGTVAAIKARLEIPGIDATLAEAIGATLEQLRLQCARLPAELPNKQRTKPATPPSATAAGGGSVAGAAGKEGGRGDGKSATDAGSTSSSSATGDGSKPGTGDEKPAAAAKSGLTAGAPAVLGPNGQAGKPVLGRAAAAAAAVAAGVTVPAAPTNEDNQKTRGGQPNPGENPAGKSDDDELVEDVDAAMDVDEIIKLLPMRHRSRLREAVNRGDSSKTAEADEDEGRSRDRERSPRPTKHNDKEL